MCVDSIILHTYVSFTTIDGTIVTILRFATCEKQSCVDINIVNDTHYEADEAFNVTLERTPGLNDRITLSPVAGIIGDVGMSDLMVAGCYSISLALHSSLYLISVIITCSK